MGFIGAAALFSIMQFGLVAQARVVDLKEETRLIAGDLLRQSPLRGKRIAVGDFTDSEGRATALSALLSENMELALVSQARSGEFRMIDRRNFQELVKEWELSVNGSVDDENLTRAGRLLGADALCIGRYTRVGKKIVLRTTLIGAEKGEILAASSTEIKLDGDLRDLSERLRPAAGPKPEPAAAAASTQTLKVELWADKAQYAVGDLMTIKVRANEDCYLTVIHVGADDKATVIFPNVYAQNNAVKAGSTYTIPDPAAGFEFEVSPPRGLELIRAVASKAPSVDLADVMRKPTAASPFGDVTQDLSVVTRAIRVKAKTAKPGEWSESVLKLSIR